MFNWLQSLVTFRNSSGGLEVPVLDSLGRIRMSVAPDNPIETGTTAPAQTDGSVIWNNTTQGNEGLYFRDQSRGRWLSSDSFIFRFGADSSDGSLLRMVGVKTAGSGSGYLVSADAVIIGISAHARAGNASKGLEIYADGSVLSTLSLSSLSHNNRNLNVDVGHGTILTAGTVSTGSDVKDIVLDVTCRWSA